MPPRVFTGVGQLALNLHTDWTVTVIRCNGTKAVHKKAIGIFKHYPLDNSAVRLRIVTRPHNHDIIWEYVLSEIESTILTP